MNNLWLKIRIWTKGIIAGLVLLYVLSFVYENGGGPVKMWWLWFKAPLEVQLLPLLLSTFGLGVITTILIRTTLTTLRQIRELRARQRSEKLEHEVADMKAKAARLQTRRPPDESDAT